MSFFRVSTVSANVNLTDLGYTIVHPAVNFIISNQFSVEDLQDSVDLKNAIVGGTLTAEVNLDGTWTAVIAASYTGDEVYAAYANIYEIVVEENNEELVLGGDTSLHKHDGRYYTKTELNSTTTPSGGSLIGIDDTNFSVLVGTDAQTLFDHIDDLFTSAVTLDAAYDNDSDGILDVDGTTKPLIFRSDNLNDVVINRTNTVDTQDILRADVSADELVLGAASVGALAEYNVRVKTNLIVDGNITFVGTITDSTVNELNVTNANIIMREGAANGADASLQVERGADGADASLKWDETADRWKAGLEGSENTIALLELDEIVTGVYEFQGGGSTEPNLYLTEKSTAPSANLGTATQIPITMGPDGILYVYDKSNSRNKWLSVQREFMEFTGRDNANNTDEYARTVGAFTSNQTGNRLIRAATLVGMSIQTNGAETWTARVRKNGGVTNLASLAASAADGNQTTTLNVDFVAGDVIQVYIDGSQVDRPVIKLEFAYKF